ncbi:pyridoxal phosphate-dependent aminotransferase [Streptomyces netropsis]|uniref:pyridoxal phosphate-dependent aminotransferase n=1 Tax=Streptomyces netropsis TaxID=55404 RepID=UPI0030D32056
MIANARRLDGKQQSTIRAMTERCVAVGGINLGQGLSRTPPPASLLDTGAAHFKTADHSYSLAQGDPALRKAIARKLTAYNGIDIDPDDGIVATIGASGAYNAVLLAYLNPGDGILLPEPFYGYHRAAAELYGVMPEPIGLTAPEFRLTKQALEASASERTRAIVLCTPNNPSGRRLTADEITAVAQFAEERDLLVITDEIYEYIYYTPGRHLSPAAFAPLTHRTITISGLSKTYSIPGWRIGYAAGPGHLIQPVRTAADILSVCAPTPLQQLAVDALELPEAFYTGMRDQYRTQRDRVASAFRSAGLEPNHPEGAYYLLIDCSSLRVQDGFEAAEAILTTAGVATIPGEAFHHNKPPYTYVRACFAVSQEDISRTEKQLATADFSTLMGTGATI